MYTDILDGVRVLDFTWVLAGPYATRLLADFGAEVIKIQSKKTAKGTESNLTGYFNMWNRNKRSITLDMSHPQAKEIVLKLITISDIVIENFSPRVMANWGLTYETLRNANPGIIMVSISAMGQSGPWRDDVAFGPTLQALAGFSRLTSNNSHSPLGIGYAHADSVIGLYAAMLSLGALEHRDMTGEGMYIDLSGYEVLCNMMGPTLLDVFLNGAHPLPLGNRSDHVPAAPYGCYRCLGSDRWCVIAVFNDDEWNALCKVMDDPFWAREERFATFVGRKEHFEELDLLISQWTAGNAAEKIVSLLQDAGVSAGVVQNARDLTEDLHLRSRHFFIKLEHPVLGETFFDASPIRFLGASARPWKAAPLFGQDNGYVYKELCGYTEENLAGYIKRGIMF